MENWLRWFYSLFTWCFSGGHLKSLISWQFSSPHPPQSCVHYHAVMIIALNINPPVFPRFVGRITVTHQGEEIVRWDHNYASQSANNRNDHGVCARQPRNAETRLHKQRSWKHQSKWPSVEMSRQLTNVMEQQSRVLRFCCNFVLFLCDNPVGNPVIIFILCVFVFISGRWVQRICCCEEPGWKIPKRFSVGYNNIQNQTKWSRKTKSPAESDVL